MIFMDVSSLKLLLASPPNNTLSAEEVVGLSSVLLNENIVACEVKVAGEVFAYMPNSTAPITADIVIAYLYLFNRLNINPVKSVGVRKMRWLNGILFNNFSKN